MVQARMHSTRLPGKVLLPLSGRPVLDHVLRRCWKIAGADVVVCVIPVAADCDRIAEVAIAAGAAVFRGPENDVLARYAGAARMIDADTVMRVTSDCPLIDPDICSAVLNRLGETRADYCCNNDPPTWPHGLDCEAMTAKALYRAHAEACAPFDREHVTPWIRRQRDFLRVNVPGPPTSTDLRWTLDYPADYAFFQAVFEALGSEATTPAVLELLAARPGIVAINAGLHRSPSQPADVN
jgi:spore coat polysaccharide biosynthesis protein SpsF